jgi:hypothetical protein
MKLLDTARVKDAKSWQLINIGLPLLFILLELFITVRKAKYARYCLRNG